MDNGAPSIRLFGVTDVSFLKGSILTKGRQQCHVSRNRVPAVFLHSSTNRLSKNTTPSIPSCSGSNPCASCLR
jgi:hypothetical protein